MNHKARGNPPSSFGIECHGSSRQRSHDTDRCPSLESTSCSVGVLVIHALSSCGHGDRDRRRDVVRARRILDRSELYE